MVVDPLVGGTELVTRFIGYILLCCACGTAGIYAFENGRRGTLGVEIWRYVILAMAVGMGYALFGSIETLGADAAGTTVTAIRLVLQLFFIVLLSLSMRELYYQLPYGTTDSDAVGLGSARFIEAGFMAAILVQFAVVIAVGLVDAVTAIQSLGAVAFAAYGVSFAARIRADTLASGTVVDVTLLHVIAVLTCLGTVGFLEGASLVGVPPTIVDSAVTVFIVMSATFLIALTIRLKQNADSMAR